jgi:hypothetical protein
LTWKKDNFRRSVRHNYTFESWPPPAADGGGGGSGNLSMRLKMIASSLSILFSSWSRFDDSVSAVTYEKSLIGIKNTNLKSDWYTIAIKSKIFLHLPFLEYFCRLFFNNIFPINPGVNPSTAIYNATSSLHSSF